LHNFIRYKKFIRQHEFGAMNVQRCDSEICTSRDPKMTTAAKKSTPSLANNNQVKAVCTGGGTRLPENRDLGERHPEYEYRGHKYTRKIVVGCAGDWPTHYEEGVIV
uniref:Ribonuclease A-domain domain-containing protein n=1 Tax=Sinocyclocheilus rhinocerous TaxID=307959 RepID=A0A673HIQ4_9TELE